MSRGIALLVGALAAMAVPEWAAACAVCTGGEDESRQAFLWTTLLLSVLPPGMVGGLVWWLWRLHRRRERSGRPLGESGLPVQSSS